MNLLRAVATVSGWTFVSRVLGFVRDMIIAKMFGAGAATDAFFVAFRIPNLLRRLFAEGAFAQAFVPILADHKNREGEASTKVLVDRVATALSSSLIIVTLIGVLAAPVIVLASAPGFTARPEKFHLTVELLRITFPYILFISLVAFAAGILNTWGRFAVPAFTPTLLNLSFIVGALFFAPYFDPPIKVLAWAVFVGGALQLAFQVPYLARIGMLPWRRSAQADPSGVSLGAGLRIAWQDEGVRRVVRNMLPALLGVSVSQISLLLNTIFASYLLTGSVSWLYYADRLMEFPTALLGVALGTVLLPSLVRHHAQADGAAYSRLLDWGLRLTIMLAAPAALALALLATPLVATLFMHGAFSANDLAQTRAALIAYSVGLLGLILVKVLVPGFYARQDIRTPVRIAVIALVATQLMNIAFIVPLKHVGLALSIGLAACLNAWLLYRKLRERDIYAPQPGWAAFGGKVGVALAVMGGALWVASPVSQWWIAHGTLDRVMVLGALVILGAVAYFGALFALGFRTHDFVQHTRR